MNLNLSPTSYPYVQKVLFKLKPLGKDGLLLNIHSKAGKGGLLYSCFHESSNILAVANNNGAIYIIDYCSGKFWKLPQKDLCCVIAFSIYNAEEIFIGIKNGDIIIVNFESGCVSGKLEGHQLAVKNLSFSKKHYCLSHSESEAILWDLATNSKIRVLHLEEGISLKQVTFIPVSCYVLACFQDDFVQIWQFQDFQSVKQFVPLNWKNRSIKSISFTKNGQTMVVAGYLPTLAFFSLDTWKLAKFITLPERILTVKYTEFVSQPFDGGCNKILAILSGQGIIYFYNIDENVIVSELTACCKASRFYLCPKGRYINVRLCSGNVQLYSLDQYTSPISSVPVQRAMTAPVSKRKIKERISKEIENIKCQIDTFLDLDKLRAILEKYGEYPEVHRLKIWEKLLKLPDNIEQYNGVINHVTMVSFSELYKQYPLESKISIQALKKLLNNIVTWCPFFVNVDFLPVFAFPFVKVFHNKPVACFEAVCTIIVNWCQFWFEYFPLPPVNILAIIENILLEHDPELLNFFRSKDITPNLYFWSLLETAFSEVLSGTEWLVLWDHVLTSEISFLHCAVVAYNITQRDTLITLETFEEFYSFYHSQNPLNMKKFIKTTYRILISTVDNLHPRQYLEKFTPLDHRSYPIFSGYPKVTVEVEERNKKIDEMLDEVLESERILREIDKSEIEKQQKRMVREEERRRLREMEKEYLKKLKDKEAVLKLEKEKLHTLEQSLGDKFKSPTDDFDEKELRAKYLIQLKDLLIQKYEVDELHKGPGTKVRSLRYDELDETINKIDKSQISIDKLKKITIAASLALLEKMIKNIDIQVESQSKKHSKNKSSDALKCLQDETKTLETEIINLLGIMAKKPRAEDKKSGTDKMNSDLCKCETVSSKQVRFS